jgi:hypothetical protein
MHADQGAEPFGGRQNLQILAIGYMEGIVSQKYLEAARAARNDGWQFLGQHRLGRIGDDLMQGVVNG